MSEINKSLTKAVVTTVSADVTTNLKWILAATEPTTPTGFARAPELDINLGIVGKFWAFIQVM